MGSVDHCRRKQQQHASASIPGTGGVSGYRLHRGYKRLSAAMLVFEGLSLEYACPFRPARMRVASASQTHETKVACAKSENTIIWMPRTTPHPCEEFAGGAAVRPMNVFPPRPCFALLTGPGWDHVTRNLAPPTAGGDPGASASYCSCFDLKTTSVQPQDNATTEATGATTTIGILIILQIDFSVQHRSNTMLHHQNGNMV